MTIGESSEPDQSKGKITTKLQCKECDVRWNDRDGHDCWVCGTRGVRVGSWVYP